MKREAMTKITEFIKSITGSNVIDADVYVSGSMLVGAIILFIISYFKLPSYGVRISNKKEMK